MGSVVAFSAGFGMVALHLNPFLSLMFWRKKSAINVSLSHESHIGAGVICERENQLFYWFSVTGKNVAYCYELFSAHEVI